MRDSAATSEKNRAGSLRELLSVAVPLIISYTTTALMYVADRVFLSWYSVESLAAALPAGVLHYNIAALAVGTVAYATAFVGQYEGADQHQRIGPVLWQGVYLSLIGAALIMIFIPFAPAIFTWFGHDQAILDLEVQYFRIMCWGTFPLLLGTTLSCFYSGRGKTLVVMGVDIAATLIDFVLDYLLIFGKFGFPRMGIRGAAWSTVIAFAVVALLYIAIMFLRERAGMYHLWTGRGFDRTLFGRLLKFGLPQGCQQFLDIACFTVFIQLVGGLGTAQLSATGLVFNLNALAFMPMLGLGTAVTALVGRRIGEGRPQLAVRTTWLAAALSMAYVTIFGGLYLFAPHTLLQLYGLEDQPALRTLVIFLLRFVTAYAYFDGLAVVFSSAIRGAGDTRFAMIFSFSLGVLLLVLPTYVASFYGDDGFVYAWYALTAFIFTLAVGFFARFQQGKWKSMRIIEHTLPELAGVPPIEEPDDDMLATAVH